MIYFARLPTGSIKIGYSANVEARMGQLRNFYRCDAVGLLHEMPGDLETEREIHDRFAHARIGMSEQFHPVADLMEFIGRPLLASPNPDARMAERQRGLAIVVIKGSEEWKSWLEDLARAARLDVSKLIDRALVEFAKREGFEAEAPER